MRTELESAMAAVITSHAAKASFGMDAKGFAASFGLAPEDIERLTTMGEDLAQLTDSFVAKRATTLRWNSRRTLALLGRGSSALVEEFINSHPATESFAAESARFGQFIVSETDALRDGTEWTEVIAAMARFEQLRSASFWGSVAAFEQTPPSPSPGSSNRRMLLRPGADAATFEWDLRQLYHQVHPVGATGEPPVRDRASLCFVHVGSSIGFRVFRLTNPELELVASLLAESSAQGLTGDTGAGSDGSDEWVVERLTRKRVIEWR